MSLKKVLSPADRPDLKERGKLLKNKVYPEKYENQISLSLSLFPELLNIPIRFEERRQWFPLASRPNWKTLNRKQNREYLILFSTYTIDFHEDILFNNLPFNAQVGILGHELCHTLFFLNKKMTGIISTGLKYLFSDYRVKFEKETDRMAIERGFGWQLLDFALYCRNHSSPFVRNWLDKYYLNPEEIHTYMKTIPDYTN